MFLRRFPGFARRFSPLWMVWLLVALFPVTREVAVLHLLGSPLLPLYDQPWRQSFGRGREFNGFRAARQKPHDLNAQLWRFSLLMQGLGEKSDDEAASIYSSNNRNPNYQSYVLSPQELLSRAQAIQKSFPREKWLRALPVKVLARRMDSWPIEKNAIQRGVFIKSRPDNERLDGFSDKRASEFLRVVQNAARLEPNNAYYALVEAKISKENHNSAAMWRALNRAAQCKVFETHDLEFARAIVAAHEAIRPLILEEKNEVWRDNNGSDDRTFDQWLVFLGHEGRATNKRGDHRRLLEIAAILASVGDLMQRGTNTRAMAFTGSCWKSYAWSMPRPIARSARRAWFEHRTQRFAEYAALHGRRDIAAQVPKWAARQRELAYLDEESLYGYGSYSNEGPIMGPSKRDALARATKWRDAGIFVLLHGLFVAVFWFLANLFLWRGAGAPSTRRARAMPALVILPWSALSGLWSWRQFEIFEAAATRWSRASIGLEQAVVTVGMLAFFGAPFLLATGCAAATMLRHKREFLASARIETELRLGRRDALILSSGAPILGALSLFSALFLWLLWLILVGFDVRTFDLLGWLPLDRKGRSWSAPQQTDVLLTPLGYCLLLCFVFFVLWFIKWRYFGGKEKRPLTHGGLRRWKEALGAYLVLTSALYFGVALASWPTRAAASRELEIRIARGELWP